jgi:hypothetical protein
MMEHRETVSMLHRSYASKPNFLTSQMRCGERESFRLPAVGHRVDLDTLIPEDIRGTILDGRAIVVT